MHSAVAPEIDEAGDAMLSAARLTKMSADLLMKVEEHVRREAECGDAIKPGSNREKKGLAEMTASDEKPT